MTPNKQVSPAIRILRGERDASARATHLEAATGKFPVTTNERKQMSTTTNFKRIALVAVAALGLGVLSSVPSQATINADSVTLSSTIAAQTTAETYTATSAVVTVSFLGAIQDSMSITAALTGTVATSTALPTLQLVETTSATIETFTTSASPVATRIGYIGDTWTANSAVSTRAQSSSAVTTAKFAVYLTKGNGVTAPSVAGTYTVKITPAANGNLVLVGSTAQTLTIVVTAAAADSVTPSTTTSQAYLQGVGGNLGATASSLSADSSVVVSKVPATPNTAIAWISYVSKNAAGAAVVESITAEITGPGTLGDGTRTTSAGRSISVRNTDSVTIFADGTSGVSTITLKGSTSGVVLTTKTVTFFGSESTLTGTALTAILAVGANTDAVKVVAADSSKVNMKSLTTGVSLYAFSSDTTIATVPATAISNYGSTESGTVTVTGVKAGTATITFGNASTLAASTIKSTPVSVRVGSTAIASVKVAFDKATYGPGEAATVTVSLLDATNLPVVPATYQIWAATYGLTASPAFFVGGPAATDTAITTSALTGLKTYTVQMPTYAGTVKISGYVASNDATSDYAKLAGTTLVTATAIQGTAISATATVNDSGAAALAAVTALATTVASLKTLITTLTNLVLKIQKKVKA